MTLTDQFIDRVCSIKIEDITPHAIQMVKTCLIDTIGVTIAGAKDLKTKDDALLSYLGGDKVICPIGSSEKTSLLNAIFLNGLNSHFLELDDGVRYGVIHPSAPLFSALVPVAQVNDVKWEQFLLGSICGYEASIRLASAMQPYHYNAGFHPTATCCTLGVAVGVAIMLGFSRNEVKDALSAASIASYGTLKVLEDVSELKPFNCAKAAVNGYIAAIMAKSGFVGPSDPLSGDTGFLKMMATQYNEDILIGKRDYFYVEKIYLKPYASCRHTHPEIEAAFKIRKEDGFDIQKVNRINVLTYKGVIGKHDGNEIYGESSARMSIPYAIAVALQTGKAGIAEFEVPYINDPFILGLNEMVVIKGDEELSKLVPDKRVAVIIIGQTDGKQFSCRVEYPKGEPENPLSDEELYAKFSEMCLHGGKTEEWSNNLFDYITKNDIINIDKIN
ncbi:MAG: MmgE/PrpD family protein [Bacteroidales bacterium]|nr:MmgE/PrpD family protein [Bacteroidales bacterium]